MSSKFLWMDAAFAWERAVADFSFSLFVGFANFLVRLGYGFKYQLSKGPLSVQTYILYYIFLIVVPVEKKDREWVRLSTDGVELLFFVVGAAVGSGLTTGAMFLVVPWPTLVRFTVWLPRMFIAAASGHSFQAFSKRYITHTAASSTVQAAPAPAPQAQ